MKQFEKIINNIEDDRLRLNIKRKFEQYLQRNNIKNKSCYSSFFICATFGVGVYILTKGILI